MRSRVTALIFSFAMLGGLLAAAHAQQNPYRLKAVDQRKLCVACHSDFEQTLKKRFVHTAVRSGECSGCHSPHVSSHSKLLSTDPRDICASCHGSVAPAGAKSTHKVVADGECQKCHDPHASDNASNLMAKGNDLCVGCHKEIGQTVKNAKFKHSPVEQGCVTCHSAHGSDKADFLLKNSVPALCVNCHKPDNASFVTRHVNYPVGKGSCTSCHDPHGSDTPGLLFPNVHAPVTNRMCSQCHEAPGSAAPFATKRAGYELCRGCHNEMVTSTLEKQRLHWPLADRKGCLNCHNPHASKQAKLLKTNTADLCGRCHADTVRRIAATSVKHAPVQEGMCVSCHSPHSAKSTYLLDQPSVNELCATCHDYGQHSAHPIGEHAVDPRNKNLRVDCRSCHAGHGTEFKRMLLAATNVELCTPCHKQYAR